MIKEQIETLLELIPARNAFLEEAGGFFPRKQDQAALYARCINDPAFAWKFVRSLVDARKSLPNRLPSFFYRAYDHLVDKQSDRSVCAAMALTFPGSETSRSLLEALLLCEDPAPSNTANPRNSPAADWPEQTTRGPSADGIKTRHPLEAQQIACWTGIAVETVRDFHDLFFNVRDRFNEKAFISGLVYPRSKLELLSQDFQNCAPAWKKLRIAALERGYAEVLTLAGILPEADTCRPAEIENAIIAAALRELQYGSSQAPVVAAALKLMQNKKVESESDDMRMGLTAISMNYEVNDMIRKLNQPAINQQIAARSAALTAESPDIKIRPSDKSVIAINNTPGDA